MKFKFLSNIKVPIFKKKSGEIKEPKEKKIQKFLSNIKLPIFKKNGGEIKEPKEKKTKKFLSNIKLPIFKKKDSEIKEPKEKKTKKPLSKKRKQIITLISGFSLVAILIFASVFLAVNILDFKGVYKGVHLNFVHLGGLTEEALIEYINNNYKIDFTELELNIYHDEYSKKIPFSNLEVNIDIEKTKSLVYNSGREGNFLKRLSSIGNIRKNNLRLTTIINYNEEVLNDLIKNFAENLNNPATGASLIILEDEVILRSGRRGYEVNTQLFKNRILQQIETLSSGIVIVPIDNILPPKIDVDHMYNLIICDKENADFNINNQGEVKVIPHTAKRTLEKTALINSVAELEQSRGQYSAEIILPVKFEKPQITTDILKEKLFSDKLSTFSSSFSTNTQNDKNRYENIKLSLNAINNTSISPGEVFSFNDVVGERSSSKGYKQANIYTISGLSTSYGGGICQVSTALFNAALRAGFLVEERHPHTYRVPYITPGLDAAVSYGTLDLKFKNNTNWPVKISAYLDNNKIIINLIGTNEYPTITYEAVSVVKETTGVNTVYIEDTNMPIDLKIVSQHGLSGATSETFFIKKNNNQIMSEHKIYTDTYEMLPEIVVNN